MKKPRWFVRNIKAETYFSQFLISAITTILLIRLLLKLTDYPQLGAGAGLHIAHVLWGGLFMMGALVVTFSFLGEGRLGLSVTLGGIGFGMFIDEIGKFLTHDNNYFFQPAVALIYSIFVLIYLTGRLLFRIPNFSNEEYLLNALEEIEEASLHDLDEESKKKTLLYLKKSGHENPLTAELINLIHKARIAPDPKPSKIYRIKNILSSIYIRLTRVPGFSTAVILFFLGELLLTLITTSVLIFFKGFGLDQILNVRMLGEIAVKLQNLGAVDWAHLISSWIASGFILAGIVRMRRSRIAAYQMFERSILVSIFLTQIFAFYKEQFSALLLLLFNIMIWFALQFMMDQERVRRQKLEF